MEPIVHYPAKALKYKGCVSASHNKHCVTYHVGIMTEGFRYTKNLPTYDEALEHLKAKNKEFNLPIRNMVYEYPTHLEVDLTGGSRMKFDKKGQELVENYCWHKSKQGYAMTNINGKLHAFHNLLLNHTPCKLTVDHQNKDWLDNRSENLRLVDNRTQMLNQNTRSDNKSGNVGVCYKKTHNAWTSQWTSEDGKQCTKWFTCKKYGNDEAKAMAIAHRKNIEETLPHYRLALGK